MPRHPIGPPLVHPDPLLPSQLSPGSAFCPHPFTFLGITPQPWGQMGLVKL